MLPGLAGAMQAKLAEVRDLRAGYQRQAELFRRRGDGDLANCAADPGAARPADNEQETSSAAPTAPPAPTVARRLLNPAPWERWVSSYRDNDGRRHRGRFGRESASRIARRATAEALGLPGPPGQATASGESPVADAHRAVVAAADHNRDGPGRGYSRGNNNNNNRRGGPSAANNRVFRDESQQVLPNASGFSHVDSFGRVGKSGKNKKHRGVGNGRSNNYWDYHNGSGNGRGGPGGKGFF
jgi:hypothetical protein